MLWLTRLVGFDTTLGSLSAEWGHVRSLSVYLGFNGSPSSPYLPLLSDLFQFKLRLTRETPARWQNKCLGGSKAYREPIYMQMVSLVFYSHHYSAQHVFASEKLSTVTKMLWEMCDMMCCYVHKLLKQTSKHSKGINNSSCLGKIFTFYFWKKHFACPLFFFFSHFMRWFI